MKKHLNTVLMALASVCSYLALAFGIYGLKGTSEVAKWGDFNKMLDASKDVTGEVAKLAHLNELRLYRTMTIILMVVAGVTLAYCVFKLLVDLKVLKLESKWLDLVGSCLLVVGAIVAVVALVAMAKYVGAAEGYLTLGAAVILPVVAYVVAAVASVIVSVLQLRESK